MLTYRHDKLLLFRHCGVQCKQHADVVLLFPFLVNDGIHASTVNSIYLHIYHIPYSLCRPIL